MWEVVPGQIDVESIVIVEEERDWEGRDNHQQGVQEADELEPEVQLGAGETDQDHGEKQVDEWNKERWNKCANVLLAKVCCA